MICLIKDSELYLLWLQD